MSANMKENGHHVGGIAGETDEFRPEILFFGGTFL